jgi:hypothetical protein
MNQYRQNVGVKRRIGRSDYRVGVTVRTIKASLRRVNPLSHLDAPRCGDAASRDGLLVPHWRELVATMSPLSGPDPMSLHPLVVTATNERPRAAWEPGSSPGWRAAADSWFDAARGALAEHRRLTLNQHAELAKLTELVPVPTRTAME